MYHLEHAFFYTDYFEKWALSNPYAGHNDDYRTYKWPMKKYIYDYDKNEEYLNTKQKEIMKYSESGNRTRATPLATAYSNH